MVSCTLGYVEQRQVEALVVGQKGTTEPALATAPTIFPLGLGGTTKRILVNSV